MSSSPFDFLLIFVNILPGSFPLAYKVHVYLLFTISDHWMLWHFWIARNLMLVFAFHVFRLGIESQFWCLSHSPLRLSQLVWVECNWATFTLCLVGIMTSWLNFDEDLFPCHIDFQDTVTTMTIYIIDVFAGSPSRYWTLRYP